MTELTWGDVSSKCDRHSRRQESWEECCIRAQSRLYLVLAWFVLLGTLLFPFELLFSHLQNEGLDLGVGICFIYCAGYSVGPFNQETDFRADFFFFFF